MAMLFARNYQETFARQEEKVMENLKRLLVAISLVVVLSGTALADCVPAAPGEVNTPPCTSITQQATDDTANQTTPPTETTSTEMQSVTLDAIVTGLENLLTVL